MRQRVPRLLAPVAVLALWVALAFVPGVPVFWVVLPGSRRGGCWAWSC